MLHLVHVSPIIINSFKSHSIHSPLSGSFLCLPEAHEVQESADVHTKQSKPHALHVSP